MTRTLLASTLALGIVTTGLTIAPEALAASHTRAHAATAHYGYIPRQVALLRAVNGFGAAGVHGPDAAINSYATPDLLAKAPAGHLINLFGPAQNPPSHYSFRVVSLRGGTATVNLKWSWGAGTANTDRITWADTTRRWKITALQYVARGTRGYTPFPASRGSSRST